MNCGSGFIYSLHPIIAIGSSHYFPLFILLLTKSHALVRIQQDQIFRAGLNEIITFNPIPPKFFISCHYPLSIRMYSFYLLALLPTALAFTGEMTYYTPGLGSCGATSTELDLIVAISAEKMNSGGNPSNNPLCFSHITITNAAGVSQDATIVDTCPGCAAEDIDVSPAVFQALASLDEGRVPGIQWSGSALSSRELSDNLLGREQ